MADHRIPLATYRVQFNHKFRFEDARQLVAYWKDLGISDVYSSPHFKARRGSSHGYDIANPMRINPELGTEQDFDALTEALRLNGMGIVLDIVPNHLAASPENPWWMDVLENGPSSPFAEYFDIDWRPSIGKAGGAQEHKILLPILHDLYGSVLHNQELRLQLDGGRVLLRHFELKLPLDPKSYRPLLQYCLSKHPELKQLEEVLEHVDQLPGREETDAQRISLRRESKGKVQQTLQSACQTPACREAMEEALRHFNGRRDDPHTFDDLDDLLSLQAYRLAHWKLGSEEINYRRFFDINELVGLRVELPEVFEWRHAGIVRLARSGRITGLRVDHVDGLRDPAGYLLRLRSAIGATPGFYVVVEKILGRDETLPQEWAADGTTGYDFLNMLNSIFVHPLGWNELQQIYARRVGHVTPFVETSYGSMKKVITDLFIGDVNSLTRELGELAAQDRYARDVPLSELKQALVEITACLPVYRTYIHGIGIADADRNAIEVAMAEARKRTDPDLASQAAFDFLRRVLLIEPPYYAEEHKAQWLGFVMRWQQFTGPVMAKGVEDTAFYRDCTLLSLNEVGGDPLRLKPLADLHEFHAFNRMRQERWPHSINATSTHDTKRGEDARARLNVLSEIPEEWDRRVDTWVRLNESRKRLVGGVFVPDQVEEWFIYQTLIGSLPGEAGDQAAFAARFRVFITKAAREAKIHSSWIQPNDAHERQLRDFVDAILTPGSAFLEDFLEFQRQIEFFGAINSLSQVLLKITAPGVPDFYQGSELYNLSMADPDNRVPVDFAKRTAMLEEIRWRESQEPEALLQDLFAQPQLAKAKLFLTRRVLQFRGCNPAVFEQGEYIPLSAGGTRSEHVCAFARKRGEHWVIVLAPRWLARLGCRPREFGSCDWGDTALVMPADAPNRWRNVLTGQIASTMQISDLLRAFPVALLSSR